MNVFMDILITLMLIGGALWGARKGFVKTVSKPIKFVAAIVIAISLASSVSSYIIEPVIGPAISNKLSDAIVEKYSDITSESADDELPTLIKIGAGLCGLDIDEIAAGSSGEQIIVEIANSVTEPIVHLLGCLMAFIVLYIGLKFVLGILLSLLSKVMDTAAKVPNRILGSVFSLFMAFVAVWGVTVISEFLFNIPVISEIGFVSRFTGGPIYSFFKSFTPIDLLLSF